MDGNNRGKVFAFDKDLRRLTLLRRRVDESGAAAGGAIETRLQDFLEVDPGDRRYSKARYRNGSLFLGCWVPLPEPRVNVILYLYLLCG